MIGCYPIWRNTLFIAEMESCKLRESSRGIHFPIITEIAILLNECANRASLYPIGMCMN